MYIDREQHRFHLIKGWMLTWTRWQIAWKNEKRQSLILLMNFHKFESKIKSVRRWWEKQTTCRMFDVRSRFTVTGVIVDYFPVSNCMSSRAILWKFCARQWWKRDESDVSNVHWPEQTHAKWTDERTNEGRNKNNCIYSHSHVFTFKHSVYAINHVTE